MNTVRNSTATVGVCRIARTLLCSCLIAVVVTVAKSADLDDPKIRRLESPPAASGLSDKTVMADHVAALDTEIGQMLAAVTRTGVSSPGQMAGILQELRVESAAHLGRLDSEEMSELMTTMRGAGVALGDRNKLRLLATDSRWGSSSAFGWQGVRRAQQGGQDELMTTMRGAGVALGDRNKLRLLATDSRWGSSSAFGSQGVRRAQQGAQDESVTDKQLKTQVEGHAGTAQPSGGKASDVSGISSDSAPPYCQHPSTHDGMHAYRMLA